MVAGLQTRSPLADNTRVTFPGRVALIGIVLAGAALPSHAQNTSRTDTDSRRDDGRLRNRGVEILVTPKAEPQK
jgi:hypothetical protein